MIDDEEDRQLIDLVNRIDDVIQQFPDMGSHNIAGVLLSRVTLLMTMEPGIGKGLVQYVWEKLDEIEQANPGGMI